MRQYYLLHILLGLSTLCSAAPASKLKPAKCGAKGPGLSCATLEVPINYDDPGAGTTDIFLARVAASNPKKRIGSLLFNPGGPGVSASALLIEVGRFGVSEILFGSDIHERFDIIAPDPRGIGQSHPIKCDPKLFNDRIAFQPTTEAEYKSLVHHSKLLGESCRNLTGPLLGHVDSQSVARDFDAIREALGDDKLNYLGISYGTVIGQAYAELFPEKIRVMALDGNLDHSLSPASFISSEAATYENVFVIFAAWCAKTASCPLHGTDVKALFKKLVAEADKKPIPAPRCAKSKACLPAVTGQDIRYNFQGFLIFKNALPNILQPGWGHAALALKQASNGNATLLSNPRAQTPSDPVIYGNGIQVLCLDWNHTAPAVSDLIYYTQMGTDVAPILQGAGASSYLEARCQGWPESVKYPPHRINVTKAPPMLLTNAYHDPETAYVWAVGLRDQLQKSVLATRNGDGHTSYFLHGQTYRAINDYLITKKTPPPNTIFDS